MLQKYYYYHWKKKEKKNQFRLKWFFFYLFYLGWGMGFMKVGLGLSEFGILDYEGFVWVCELNPPWMCAWWLWIILGVAIRVHMSVRVVSIHEYSTIWVNTNPTCLLNELRFLNPNTTYLLNRPIVSTCLLDFIKMKKKIMKKQTNKYF